MKHTALMVKDGFFALQLLTWREVFHVGAVSVNDVSDQKKKNTTSYRDLNNCPVCQRLETPEWNPEGTRFDVGTVKGRCR